MHTRAGPFGNRGRDHHGDVKGSQITPTPKQDLMKRLKTFVDVTSEAHDIPPPMGTTHMDESVPMADTEEDWDFELKRGHKRNLPAELKISLRRIAIIRRRWNQLVSINRNRRLEGLPPMMQLPDSQATEPLPQDLGQGQSSEQGILGFQIAENDDTQISQITDSFGVDMKETILNAFRQSDSEVKQNIRDAVNMAHDYTEETQVVLAKNKIRKIERNMFYIFYMRCMTRVSQHGSSKLIWTRTMSMRLWRTTCSISKRF